jgi:outer membrane protein assembly factor BamB
MSRTAIFAVVVVLSSLSARATDWPSFRGPTGNGITSDQEFPTRWGPDESIRWTVKLPAPGNGSPIVSNGRVFLTVAEDQGRKRSLVGFDRADGKHLWTKTVTFDKVMPTHQTNPHGSSTPAANGERVVVWHASAGLYCYDFSGKELWSRNLGEFRHMWGYGTSPIIYRDRVIMHCGPGQKIFLTALDLESGKTVWQTDEPVDGDGDKRASDGAYMGSWATPVIAQVDGKDQIICTLPTRVNGYDPETGDILWTCDGIRGKKGDLAYSSPLVSGSFCVSVGGFGGPSIGFKLGGKGNITETNRVWRMESNPQSIGTGVFLGKHIFRPNAGPGTIECLVAETGKVLWADRAAGANHWGSMVFADGHLYVTNQDGTTVVFKPNPEKYEEVARNDLREHCNTTPAFSDGEIFLRTSQQLHCIGK